MANMLAAVFKGNGVLELEQVPVPQVRDKRDVLLKIRAASICGSDLHGLSVPPGQHIDPGVIMGHEFCGTVEAVGEGVDEYRPGDEVAVNPCLPCGACWECKHGFSNLCVRPHHYGQTCDGGFAQYAVVDAGQLYRLPEGADPAEAAQTEPLACVMSGMKTVKPLPTERVLLYGAGPIGLTFIKVLRIFGVRQLAVVAKGEKRIEQALRCGADVVIDSQREQVRDALLRHWDTLADVVIDAVGTGAILTEAVRLLNSRGRFLLFGLNHNAIGEVPPAVFTQKELQMMGVLSKSFPEALALLGDERLRLTDLISHRLPLAEIERAFALLRAKEASRVILYPNGGLPT